MDMVMADMDMVTMDIMEKDPLKLNPVMGTMAMDMDMDMVMVMATMDEHKARISSKSSKMKWILLNLVKI